MRDYKEEIEAVLDAEPDEEKLIQLLTDWQHDPEMPGSNLAWSHGVRRRDALLINTFNSDGQRWALPTLLNSGIYDWNRLTNKDDILLLNMAASFAKPGITHLLLQQGADPNIRDENGQTALHAAASETFYASTSTYEIVLLLLDYGANPNLIDNNGCSPRDYAYYSLNAAVYRLLTIRHAVWGTAEDLPPLLHHYTLLGNINGVEERLVAGDLIDEHDTCGRTSLHIAATIGDVSMVRLLLARGAVVDSRTRDGQAVGEVNIHYQTPLHVASQQGHIAVAELLLSAGADVEARDYDGFSPLVYAAIGCNAEAMIRYLLKMGADAATDGTLPDVCQFCIPALVDILLAGREESWSAEELAKAVHRTRRSDDSHNLAPLARYGADISVTEAVGWSGDIDIVRAAIARGRDVNGEYDRNAVEYGKRHRCYVLTPLMKAAKLGRVDLVEHGADPNRVEEGRTALDYAEHVGAVECAALLRTVTKRVG